MSLYSYLSHEYYYALSLADHYDLYPWDSMILNTSYSDISKHILAANGPEIIAECKTRMKRCSPQATYY
jgi:hypothetical protein